MRALQTFLITVGLLCLIESQDSVINEIEITSEKPSKISYLNTPTTLIFSKARPNNVTTTESVDIEDSIKNEKVENKTGVTDDLEGDYNSVTYSYGIEAYEDEEKKYGKEELEIGEEKGAKPEQTKIFSEEITAIPQAEDDSEETTEIPDNQSEEILDSSSEYEEEFKDKKTIEGYEKNQETTMMPDFEDLEISKSSNIKKKITEESENEEKEESEMNSIKREGTNEEKIEDEDITEIKGENEIVDDFENAKEISEEDNSKIAMETETASPETSEEDDEIEEDSGEISKIEDFDYDSVIYDDAEKTDKDKVSETESIVTEDQKEEKEELDIEKEQENIELKNEASKEIKEKNQDSQTTSQLTEEATTDKITDEEYSKSTTETTEALLTEEPRVILGRSKFTNDPKDTTTTKSPQPETTTEEIIKETTEALKKRVTNPTEAPPASEETIESYVQEKVQENRLLDERPEDSISTDFTEAPQMTTIEPILEELPEEYNYFTNVNEGYPTSEYYEESDYYSGPENCDILNPLSPCYIELPKIPESYPSETNHYPTEAPDHYNRNLYQTYSEYNPNIDVDNEMINIEYRWPIARVSPNHRQCHLELNSGTGPEEINSWYFDRQDNKCKWFSYGGYGGNANRFNTRAACIHLCMNNNDDPCMQENLECWGSTRCEALLDIDCYEYHRSRGGNAEDSCPPAQPVCMTKRRSRIQPKVDTSRVPAECTQTEDAGTCMDGSPVVRYYYDTKHQTCKSFYYYKSRSPGIDCGGNSNRFVTKGDCMNYCSP